MTTTNYVPDTKRWDTFPDRESLRVIYRFLNQREEIENVSLEPYRTHPRLVTATITDRVSSTPPSIFEVRWYETGDFVITYQKYRTNDAPLLVRWTSYPDKKVVVSYTEPDGTEELNSPFNMTKSRFHPIKILSLVIATVEEDLIQT